jgi:D-glycero-alpha-D-manno-heptose-7-phosphate kinase
MIVRSKAPLRLGLAGGGTDVSPYSDLYGGAVLNATVSLYAYATIEPRTDNKIVIRSIDKDTIIELQSSDNLEIDGNLDLIKGVYNRIIRDYKIKPLSFTLTSYVDAPAGSGLGTSSTVVTAVLGAFSEWLKLPLGESCKTCLRNRAHRPGYGRWKTGPVCSYFWWCEFYGILR